VGSGGTFTMTMCRCSCPRRVRSGRVLRSLGYGDSFALSARVRAVVDAREDPGTDNAAIVSGIESSCDGA
jgi:hypothetical protein